MKKTAAASKAGINEADEPKVTLTVLDAVGHFMQDMKAFVSAQMEHNEEISDKQLKDIFKAELCNELALKYKNVEFLEKTVNDVINYLSEDWSTFVEMAKETFS